MNWQRVKRPVICRVTALTVNECVPHGSRYPRKALVTDCEVVSCFVTTICSRRSDPICPMIKIPQSRTFYGRKRVHYSIRNFKVAVVVGANIIEEAWQEAWPAEAPFSSKDLEQKSRQGVLLVRCPRFGAA
jgi:hypothetical protein